MVVSLAMGWRHLLFENWRVEPTLLDAHLPDALAPDLHDGSAWLSVVPFTIVDARPTWLPRSLGIRLPELNLRTYVTYDDVPATYFFSLDAAGLLSVLGARLLQHLPYYYAGISLESTDGRITFESRRRHPGARPAAYEATYAPTGDAFAARDDPLASFLVERYRLYTQATDGSLRYTEIDHEPWTLYPADATVERNTLFAANGFDDPAGAPVRYYSPGLDVVAGPSRPA